MKLKENFYKPLYKQLKEILLKEINDGNLNPGERVPSENELIEKYEVSRITVRNALSELADEGVLIKIQGKGTFVLSHPPLQPFKNVISFTKLCEMQNLKPSARILRCESVIANENELSFFNLPVGSPVILLKRLRLADNVPIIIETNYFDMSLDFLLNESHEGSLYERLEEHDIFPSKSTSSIELYNATEDEAELLDITISSPLLLRKGKSYDAKGCPLHTSKHIVRVDKDMVFKYYV